MEKYTDLVLGQNGQTLLPIQGATVTVLNYPSGTVATIYSDNGITITGNPLITDVNGRFYFYAANGRYSMQIAYLSISYTLNDVPLEDDPASGQSVIITGGSIDNTPIGGTTPSTGAFTSLSSSSGSLNGSIGGTTPGAGIFTTLTSTGTTALGATSATSINTTPVGATTPSSGAFTTLSSTGTTSLGATSASSVNSTPIGGTTPSTGAFTTISATGTITPSQTAGIVGTTAANNANAGSVGEYVTQTVNGVSLTTTVANNITSISLTAGDWDVAGGIAIIGSTANITDATGGANTTSATFGGFGTFFELTAVAFTNTTQAIPRVRISVASTTTVFLIARATFAAGTVAASGTISARRMR